MKKITRIGLILVLLLSIAGQAASFTWGTSGAPSDPPWTEVRSGLTQTANTLVSTGSSFGLIRYNAATFTQAQYVEAAFAISSADIFNGQQLLYLRFTDIDNYIQINFDDGRHDPIIRSRIAGTEAPLATITLGSNFVLGDIAKADITTAGLITLYRNGVSFGTYDATLINATLTGNSFGLGMTGTTTDQGAWGAGQGGDVGGGGGGATNSGRRSLLGVGP